MAKRKKPFNPFYALLVVVGVAFVVTASSYGVMTIKKANPHQSSQTDVRGPGLVQFMDQHGTTVMLVEIALLAAATFGAIGTEDYWVRLAARNDGDERSESEAASS